MDASHLFRLSAVTPQTIRLLGSRTDVNKSNFSVLTGMSISLLSLASKGFREPHWHPNANELSYCLEGKAVMTIFSPRGGHDTFTIETGDIVFVPKGYLHHIENQASASARFLIAFDQAHPEDLELSTAVNCMSNHVLHASLKAPDATFEKCKKTQTPVFIAEKTMPPSLLLHSIPSRYKLNLHTTIPQVQSAGGTVTLSNAFLLPELSGLACYYLRLFKSGIREPHWHPNAAELNYLIQGAARITLLSPGGHIETFDMQKGDMSFMPQGYFHHIENIGEEEVQFAVFFNNENPSDLGITGSFGAYSNELLASLFGLPLEALQDMPKYQEDKFVVSGAG